MSPSSERPSWQDDTCPPWCVVTHRESDHPDDRFHDSATASVAAVVGPAASTADLMVVTSRRCGTSEDWTYVGRPDDRASGLTLSPESARRLAVALDRHLDAL